MAVPVGFHPEALEESVAAERWYRERSHAAAEAFVAEIERAVDLIGEAPERWPGHVRGTRRFPFAIICRAGSTGAAILAVAHGRRRPGYWKHR